MNEMDYSWFGSRAIIALMTLAVLYGVVQLRSRFSRPKRAIAQDVAQGDLSAPSSTVNLGEDVQYVGGLAKWAYKFFVALTVVLVLIDLFLILAWLFGSADSAHESSGEAAVGFSVIALFLIGLSFLLWFKMSGACYREGDTYCILEVRGTQRRLEFANIAKWKITLQYGKPYEFKIVDTQGQKFKINLTWFEPRKLVEYLGRRNTERLAALEQQRSAVSDPALEKEISRLQFDVNQLGVYWNYLNR